MLHKQPRHHEPIPVRRTLRGQPESIGAGAPRAPEFPETEQPWTRAECAEEVASPESPVAAAQVAAARRLCRTHHPARLVPLAVLSASGRPRGRQAPPRGTAAVTPRPAQALCPRLGNPRDRLGRRIACRALCTNLWMAVDGLCRTASSLCTSRVKRWIPKMD